MLREIETFRQVACELTFLEQEHIFISKCVKITKNTVKVFYGIGDRPEVHYTYLPITMSPNDQCRFVMLTRHAIQMFPIPSANAKRLHNVLYII